MRKSTRRKSKGRLEVRESLYKTVSYEIPTEEAAAIIIQAAYRGHLARKRVKKMKEMRRLMQRRNTARRLEVKKRTSDFVSSTPVPQARHRRGTKGTMVAGGSTARGNHYVLIKGRGSKRESSSSSTSRSVTRTVEGRVRRRRRTRYKVRGTYKDGKRISSADQKCGACVLRETGDNHVKRRQVFPQREVDPANAASRFEHPAPTRATVTERSCPAHQVPIMKKSKEGDEVRPKYTNFLYRTSAARRHADIRRKEKANTVNHHLAMTSSRRQMGSLEYIGVPYAQDVRFNSVSGRTAGEFMHSGRDHYQRIDAKLSEVEGHPDYRRATLKSYTSVESLTQQRDSDSVQHYSDEEDTTSCTDAWKPREYRRSTEISYDSHIGREQRYLESTENSHLRAIPLKADSAANPLLILKGAISPQHNNDTLRQPVGGMDVCGSHPNIFLEESSEDTSPPLEKKQLRFMSPPNQCRSRSRTKSYEDLVREGELHNLRNLGPRRGTEESRRYDKVVNWIETTHNFRSEGKESGPVRTARKQPPFLFAIHEMRTKPKGATVRVPTEHTSMPTVHKGDALCPKQYSSAGGPEEIRERPWERTEWPLTGQRKVGTPSAACSQNLQQNTGRQCMLQSTVKDRNVSLHENGVSSHSVWTQTLKRKETAENGSKCPFINSCYAETVGAHTVSWTARKTAASPCGFEEDAQSQFYTCHGGPVLTEAGSYESDVETGGGEERVLWDPLCNVLPPMPRRTAEERQKTLRCLRSERHYANDMAVVTKLQNTACHNLLLIGGISLEQPTEYLDGSALLIHHPGRDVWFFLGTMPEPRCYHAAVVVGSNVIVTGGFDPLAVTEAGRMRASSKVLQLSLRSLTWRTLASMHRERAYHAAVVFQDRIFVFGGMDNTNRILPSAEVYYTKLDQWRMVHPMPKPMIGVGATALGGKIWVLGGLTQDHQGGVSPRKSAYCFDPKTDSWSRGVPMLQRRAFCSAVSVTKQIWVVGGVVDFRSLRCTSRIDFLDVSRGTWERRADLTSPRHSVCAAKAGPAVFLVGGQASDSRVCAEVSCFDRRDGGFHSAAVLLPRAVAGIAAVGIPRDRSALRLKPWPAWNATEEDRRNGAIIIQRAFRLYLKRGSLKRDYTPQLPPVEADGRDGSQVSLRDKCWPSVHIGKWPPTITSSLELGTGLGDGALSQDDHLRYVTLPSRMDPNLGMLLSMDDSFLKTKKVLGLRLAPDVLPAGIRELRKSSSICQSNRPVILILGGLDPRNPLCSANGSAVLKYHPIKDRWAYVNTIPEPRCYHAAVYTKGKIFITGGYSYFARRCGEMVASRTTFCLDVGTGTWERAPDMSCPRACHSASVADNGCFYAFGGRGHHGRLLSSVEEYDPSAERWQQRASMPEPRMGMATVHFAGSVWLLGGMTDNRVPVIVADVIAYLPRTNSWCSCCPLRVPRAFASASVVGDQIWLCGGCRDNEDSDGYPVSMCSVDVLPSAAPDSHWERVCRLGIARHAAAVAALGPLVYIFGGITSTQWGSLSKATALFTSRSTVLSPCGLPVPVTGHAAVTLLQGLSTRTKNRWGEAVLATLTCTSP